MEIRCYECGEEWPEAANPTRPWHPILVGGTWVSMSSHLVETRMYVNEGLTRYLCGKCFWKEMWNLKEESDRVKSEK